MNKNMLTHGSLFSGIGGFDLAAEWAGFENKFHCEWNQFGQQVLKHHFPKSESYEDITKTDFKKWRGQITVLSGGFPCQPFSLAGKRKGADDDRYLWPEMLRAIDEIGPTWVIGENVAGIATMVQPGKTVGVESQAALFEENDTETTIEEQEYVIETVCSDLERIGYSVQPLLIPACAVGAPHRRDRIWFIARLIADPDGERFDYGCNNREERSVYCNEKRNAEKDKPEWSEWERRTCEICCDGIIANSDSERQQWGIDKNGPEKAIWEQSEGRYSWSITGGEPGNAWQEFPTQPPVYAGDDGISRQLAGRTISCSKWRQESVKACGNAIVPQVAYEIFKCISELTKH